MPSSILNSDDGVISGTSGLKSSGGDDGVLAVQSNGTEVAKFKTTELVINDGGANYDFRVEGDADANLLFVDASADRIGIGTSTPTVRLNVANTSADCVVHSQALTNGFAAGYRMVANNDAGAAFNFLMSFSGSTEQWYIGGNGNNNTIVFANGSARTERVRITSSGAVRIGGSFTSGAAKFGVNNTNNVSGDQNTAFELGANCNNTSSFHLICATGGLDKLYIYGNGNVQNVNNSYGSLSDIKLKENVVDATPKLDKLNQVRIVNYNLIGDEKKQIGVIAQELEQIFPSMVEETPDRDAEGNDLGTTTKGVKYSVFVPMLIKSIQELSAKNDALEARIAALEAVPGNE